MQREQSPVFWLYMVQMSQSNKMRQKCGTRPFLSGWAWTCLTCLDVATVCQQTEVVGKYRIQWRKDRSKWKRCLPLWSNQRCMRKLKLGNTARNTWKADIWCSLVLELKNESTGFSFTMRQYFCSLPSHLFNAKKCFSFISALSVYKRESSICL